jgi:hypothetical protein
MKLLNQWKSLIPNFHVTQFAMTRFKVLPADYPALILNYNTFSSTVQEIFDCYFEFKLWVEEVDPEKVPQEFIEKLNLSLTKFLDTLCVYMQFLTTEQVSKILEENSGNDAKTPALKADADFWKEISLLESASAADPEKMFTVIGIKLKKKLGGRAITAGLNALGFFSEDGYAKLRVYLNCMLGGIDFELTEENFDIIRGLAGEDLPLGELVSWGFSLQEIDTEYSQELFNNIVTRYLTQKCRFQQNLELFKDQDFAERIEAFLANNEGYLDKYLRKSGVALTTYLQYYKNKNSGTFETHNDILYMKSMVYLSLKFSDKETFDQFILATPPNSMFEICEIVFKVIDSRDFHKFMADKSELLFEYFEDAEIWTTILDNCIQNGKTEIF